MYKKALSASCAIVGFLIYNLFAIAGASNLYDKSPIVAPKNRASSVFWRRISSICLITALSWFRVKQSAPILIFWRCMLEHTMVIPMSLMCMDFIGARITNARPGNGTQTKALYSPLGTLAP